jgi:hypothetical protein
MAKSKGDKIISPLSDRQQQLFSSLLALNAKKAVVMPRIGFFAQFVTIFCNDFKSEGVYNSATLRCLLIENIQVCMYSVRQFRPMPLDGQRELICQKQ